MMTSITQYSMYCGGKKKTIINPVQTYFTGKAIKVYTSDCFSARTSIALPGLAAQPLPQHKKANVCCLHCPHNQRLSVKQSHPGAGLAKSKGQLEQVVGLLERITNHVWHVQENVSAQPHCQILVDGH